MLASVYNPNGLERYFMIVLTNKEVSVLSSSHLEGKVFELRNLALPILKNLCVSLDNDNFQSLVHIEEKDGCYHVLIHPDVYEKLKSTETLRVKNGYTLVDLVALPFTKRTYENMGRD